MKVMSTPPHTRPGCYYIKPGLALIWIFNRFRIDLCEINFFFIHRTLEHVHSSDVLVLIMIYVGEEERILDWRPPNICLAMVYHGIRNINHT